MSDTEFCQKCGCHYKVHRHITTKFNTKKRQIVDTNMQKQIQTKEDAKNLIKATLTNLRKQLKGYRREYEVIKDVSTKFAIVLAQNSNVPYNTFIEPYLDLLINEEKNRLSDKNDPVHQSPNPFARLNQLQDMKETHTKSVQILEEAIKNGGGAVSVKLEDVFNLRNKLLKLPISGLQFQQILTASDQAREAGHRLREQFVDFRNVHRSGARQSGSTKSSRNKVAPSRGGGPSETCSNDGSVPKQMGGQRRNEQSGTRSPKSIIYSRPSGGSTNDSENAVAPYQGGGSLQTYPHESRATVPKPIDGHCRKKQSGTQSPKSITYPRHSSGFTNDPENAVTPYRGGGPLTTTTCSICDGLHSSHTCEAVSVQFRRSRVNVRDLCSLCLLPGHALSACASNGFECSNCGDRNHCAALCDN